MKTFFRQEKRSACYAKERMKLLLNMEHAGCSQQILEMLRNDIIKSVNKYFVVNEEQVSIQISRNPSVLYTVISLVDKRNG